MPCEYIPITYMQSFSYNIPVQTGAVRATCTTPRCVCGYL